MVPRELREIRKRIDQIDRDLVRLIDRRYLCAERAASIKDRHSFSYTDRRREGEIIDKVRAHSQYTLVQQAIVPIYGTLLGLSKQIRFERRRGFSAPVSIGIIGYGRFGRFLATVFRRYWEHSTVKVCSPRDRVPRHLRAPIGRTAAADLVIPCVPISSLPEVLRELKPFLQASSTVVDVCSVKVAPVRWMRDVLGRSVSMIATHPMFGPDSTRDGKDFLGKNMMTCNLSAPVSTYETYRMFWQGLGVNMVEMTPREHDRCAAYTLNYSQLLGRIAGVVGVKPTPIDTDGFKVIYGASQAVDRDTWQLFVDLQTYNPYARGMLRKVGGALRRIEKAVADGRRRAQGRRRR